MAENKKGRFTFVYILTAVVVAVFIIRLFNLQVVNGDMYQQMSQNRSMSSISVLAPRGEIYDRYGRPLVTNRTGFTVQLQKTDVDDETFHQALLKMIALFEQNGDSYYDSLPITEAPYEFIFDEGEDHEKSIAWKQKMELPEDATAAEAMEELRNRYKVNEAYGSADVRKLVGILYEMKQRGFSYTTPFVVAKDVHENTVMQLEERHADFPGVFVLTEPIRQYASGSLGAHVMGRVDIIYEEEYQELKDKGYGMNDMIGKDGLEKILEEDLKGVNGIQQVSQTLDGKNTELTMTKAATPGKNVILTIDAELQAAVEKSLEENIKRIQSTVAPDADSGAAIVIDVNTGEVLAMASYPYFNVEDFNKLYNELIKDPSRPMLNRAIAGLYPPASTFKMLTGIAAMEEGVVTADTTVTCEGLYHYLNETKRCWIYTDLGGKHGPMQLTSALANSCNCYFYDVAKNLGIDKLEEYGKLFGLGEYTGIELTGEEKGIFAGKTYRSKLDMEWWPGETLSAAIGQMHIFTPIQLVDYVATIANGGTRYRPHLVKTVLSNDPSEADEETIPYAEAVLNINPETIQVVQEGMKGVTEDNGTASAVFKEFPITVAGKSGSAEVTSGTSNGVFVGFAPYDNPEIAVAVVIEHGKSGSNTAPVVRDVFQNYFHVDEVASPDRDGVYEWLQ